MATLNSEAADNSRRALREQIGRPAPKLSEAIGELVGMMSVSDRQRTSAGVGGTAKFDPKPKFPNPTAVAQIGLAHRRSPAVPVVSRGWWKLDEAA
jgi:hypothetical protein